jgi:hypothetical protein
VIRKNVTLALDEQTLNAGRAYAQKHQTTLNALVRDLLVKTVGGPTGCRSGNVPADG